MLDFVTYFFGKEKAPPPKMVKNRAPYTPVQGDVWERGKQRVKLSIHYGAGVWFVHRFTRSGRAEGLEWDHKELIYADPSELPARGWTRLPRDSER